MLLFKISYPSCNLYGTVVRSSLKKHNWLVWGKKTVERKWPFLSSGLLLPLANQTLHPKWHVAFSKETLACSHDRLIDRSINRCELCLCLCVSFLTVFQRFRSMKPPAPYRWLFLWPLHSFSPSFLLSCCFLLVPCNFPGLLVVFCFVFLI